MTSRWTDSYRAARLEEVLPSGAVRCGLSPRRCVIADGKQGFCGVRGNRDGRLVTFNFGKGVHPTEELIETEAVNHFAPGIPILSLGNIGCMLSCDYCHNWKTSQAKHLSDRDIVEQTPEGIVATAKRHGIRCLSWTYNDPVVWHEFVLETAALARREGMFNLYKSAFFITPEAVEELLPVIDIFSISVKSVDPDHYRRLTKGWLAPVLEAAHQVYDAGKHLEVSTLMVTDVSDDEATARGIATFVLDRLGPEVPLHFVRYHPDFRMAGGARTPIERLRRAREVAMSMGVEHVYNGNVHDPAVTSTWCRGCGEELVSRYGLNARVLALDAAGRCLRCRRDANVKHVGLPVSKPTTEISIAGQRIAHRWRGDVSAAHVQVRNGVEHTGTVLHRRVPSDDTRWTVLTLAPGEGHRFLLAKSFPGETGIELIVSPGIDMRLHEVFDRAHFPTVSTEDGTASTDRSPLPIYRSA